ncbi:hypothetical protein BGW38_003933 [Lunasporangiospora selenospora]|uniref:Uncharacterized protein n=1 Tax=Lunasporangiospora selenospora TaxID=979761 RepID=A0A9P6G0D3_9FUNG|nr:hypothetical protein BGW38_003933 [Lunasporangiospora selenospora]
MDSQFQKPTWLNQLPDHSIFELDEQEYLEWARLNNSSAGATTVSTTSKAAKSGFGFGVPTTFTSDRDSVGLDELKEDYEQLFQGLSCMAIHGQDLYVAVGRQVRYTSLADLKKGVETHGRNAAASYIQQKQHKVLKIQNIDFDIRRLVLNQEGKLMAIVGDEKVVIAALPKTIKQDPKAVNCKSFILGEYYHINKGPTKVVKVLWHPLSKGFTHVLILTHDSLLRMYDVATDIDEPEQIYNFGSGGRVSGVFGPDVDDAASFCFGSKYSEWGQLSVYCLTHTGDIFMICPVMPENCLLEKSDLDEIRSNLENVDILASADDSEATQAAFGKEWVKSLLESVQPHPFSDEVVIVRSPILKHAEVVRQGPFLYQPPPIELDDDDNKASDILCLETEAAEVIAVAHSCGKVDICIAVDRPMARWAISRPHKSSLRKMSQSSGSENIPTDLPVISVYESVDLGLLKVFGVSSTSGGRGYGLQENRLSIPNHPVLVPDTMYGDMFYVYHEAGAHCVSVRPWLDRLSALYEAASLGQAAGLDGKIAAFYDAKVKSTVGCIVNTRPTRASAVAPVIGCSVVTDAYLEYSLLLLTSSLQLIGLELIPRPRTTTASSTAALDSTGTFGSLMRAPNNSTGSPNDEVIYQNTLTLPMFENQDLLSMNGLPLQPKVVLPPGVGSAKIIVTEENLEFLGKMVQGIRESLRDVYTSCDIAQQRMVAQEAEYKRQQDKVNKTHEHIRTTLANKMQQQVDRQDAQNALQRKLMARADELLQRLMESREPELSPAEKQWVHDVAKSEKAVKTFDERRNRVLAQHDILKRRLQEMNSTLQGSDGVRHLGSNANSNEAHVANPRYGTAQLKTVESALSVESQLLDTTLKMVADVSSRLEVLDISREVTEA